MKHQKEWYTCDRCGNEIKYTLIRRGKLRLNMENQNGYVAENVNAIVDELCERFGIVLYTTNKNIDLRPKCRKDFERFMRNDS